MHAPTGRHARRARRSWPAIVLLMLFAGLVSSGAAHAGAPDDTVAPEPVDAPQDTLATDEEPDEEPEESTPPTSSPTEGTGQGQDDPDESVVARPGAAPSVRDSDIPIGSIIIALIVFAAVGVTSIVVVRRHPRTATSPRSGPPQAPHPAPSLPNRGTTSSIPPERTVAGLSAGHAETLEFLIELGEALLDAGDSVGHVESTLRSVAELNGIDGLGVVALPSSIVLSVHQDDSVVTEVRTSTSAALRLDQIDDVLHVVHDAERAAITAAEGRRELERIRAAPPAMPPRVLLAAYVVSTVGLAMVLRGGWLEVALAAALGVVIGALRLATASQRPAYQAFWPLIAAATVSASVFAAARVLDDLVVFPALVSPLITFLPGGLLTIAVLELSTGQTVSGASRLAAGAMQLVLLALGIVAGASSSASPGVTSGRVATGSSRPWFRGLAWACSASESPGTTAPGERCTGGSCSCCMSPRPVR